MNVESIKATSVKGNERKKVTIRNIAVIFMLVTALF